MEPLGTSIGLIISISLSTRSPAVEGMITAIAAGTFVYVAVMDILAEEFSHKSDRWWKGLFLLIGVGMTAGILFSLPHDHD